MIRFVLPMSGLIVALVATFATEPTGDGNSVVAANPVAVRSPWKQESQSEESEKQKILDLIQKQQDAWNEENIEGFMDGYWQSEQMSFAGGGKLVRGWQATLDRYKLRYPKGSMGHLEFEILETRLIGDRAAMVLGNYHLTMPDEKNSTEDSRWFSKNLTKAGKLSTTIRRAGQRRFRRRRVNAALGYRFSRFRLE
ncbi:MAG: hypothetical protein R3C03_11420 [Pirellulaceae bacterium]